MPELPEVETVRRGLLSTILGEVIVKVEVYRQESVAYPKPKKFSLLLPGHRVIDVNRRGKYLLLHLKKKNHPQAFLVVHLRMSGRLLLTANRKRAKKTSQFLRLRLLFASGKELLFEDMRVFGRLWFVGNDSQLPEVIPALAELGPEPLSGLTASQLKQIFSGRRQSIKAALLDQTLLAGIGNIYADEILFKAEIHPLMAAGSLTTQQNKLLIEVIPQVLHEAIALGGSSLKDFKDSAGVNGNYQHNAFVYGRAGKPCRICGVLIEKVKIIGRSSHFCPCCQTVSVNSARENKQGQYRLSRLRKQKHAKRQLQQAPGLG